METRWMDPPAEVRRFTLNQIAQHWLATALWIVLAVTAGVSWWLPPAMRLHSIVGLVSAGFFFWHLFTLVAIGIRHDVTREKIALLPSGGEWRFLRGRSRGVPATGKYSPEEKGDYLAIVCWAILLASSGICLRWPGTFGISSARLYDWMRVLHAGCGGALSLHVLLVHIPGRWLHAPRPLRRAMYTGNVPLKQVEERPGWVSDLRAAGVLIPVPRTTKSQADRESGIVRTLLEEGNQLVKAGKYGEAATVFEEALNLFPGYSQARYNLGVARWKEGREDLAAEHFRQFIDMDPFNPMAEKARDMLESVTKRKNGEDR